VSAAADTDPYLPGHGDSSYRVERYELDLDYRVATNRLAGRAVVTAVTDAPVSRLRLDLAGLRVTRVRVDGRRSSRFSHRGGALTVDLGGPVETGTRLLLDVQYDGTPRPLRSHWGEVGFEELTDGVIVAGQPCGAPSWFPCNDRADDKAAYRISVTTESAYTVVANGTLTGLTRGSSRTTWVFDQPEPMATYLATLQIGRYATVDLGRAPVPQRAAVPARLRGAFDHDFARQGQMLAVFERLFGPYPFGSYSVVVTDDDLEIPLEAQGLSVFGANHVDGRRGSERLVAHELAHQWFGNSVTARTWQHIWLHEGFACYAEWLWAEESGGGSAEAHARRAWTGLKASAQDLVIADPGPELMFDDRLYKRGALTLHALRSTLGDEAFFLLLHEWTQSRRHGTATTADLTDLARRYSPDGATDALLDAWLHQPRLPPLPSGRVTGVAALAARVVDAARHAPPGR
jgi:aminopeptidase